VVRDPGAAGSRSIDVLPIAYTRWVALPWTSTPYRAAFAKELSLSTPGAGTALLRVNTFVNYREPVDPVEAYAALFRRVSAAGARRLVIDLRENGGGSDDAALALLRFVTDTPLVLWRPSWLKAVRYGDLPRYVQTWGDASALFEPPLERFTRTGDGWYEERAADQAATPAADRFRGPVTVLIGPRMASGATMVAAALRDAGRVRLVGEPTGGSAEGGTAGQIFFVKLPASGITVRVPVKRVRTAVRAFRPGYGVFPDVAVTPTLDDFLAGRDPVLEAALR
jgi:C-terminal processing protease CtpA/Prc